ncbi:MAG: hypothetical protein BWZ10_01081 [candidate division BRC1 bacterium ADurb.BinA364]|nr:MAG: hypothetical protein BWZ10_01081 [candidate division BRC1 bacterium ADurb.BinA364]
MSARQARRETVRHQPSFILETPDVRLAMTERGGHMAPVEFLRGGSRPFEPYYVAPWAGEPDLAAPSIIQVLRGDFFCCPFGGNAEPFAGERHPVHGETANETWTLRESGGENGAWMRLDLELRIRPGRVEKFVALADGQNVVYQTDAISGMDGPMNFGHHATLLFPDEEGAGRLSFSPLRKARVYVKPTENTAERGYSILKPGAAIDSLSKVERSDGRIADLTRYPARRGFEDIAILCAAEGLEFGWSAAAIESQGAVWFSLRDPRILPSTLLWHSNGGRHYPPWSGRNINTLGIEDILGYFHEGLAASARENDLSAAGIPTSRIMRAGETLRVRYIQGAAAIPPGFGAVRAIERAGSDAIRLAGEFGHTVEAPCRLDYLWDGQAPGVDAKG